MKNSNSNSSKVKVIMVLVLLFSLDFSVNAQTLKGKDAFGGWKTDKPGVRRLFTIQDLQPISKPTYGLSEVVPMPAGVTPQVPANFSAELVTSEIKKPRVIRTAPNGDLFVAESMNNSVHVLRFSGGSSKVEHHVFATGLTQPYGIAFYPADADPHWIYIANSDSVVRFPYSNGDLEAKGTPERIVTGIPPTHHYGRDIVFAPGSTRLFLSIGSGSNIALDMFPEPRLTMVPEPRAISGLAEWAKVKPLGATWDTEELRANVLSVNPGGDNLKIFATGLRNCQGMAIQQATQQLWCVVNERDEIGDDVPFEYATHVEEGAFYGWPWYYIGGNEDPRHANQRPDLKDKVKVPDVLMQPHSAPLQITFYDGDQFPAEYKGSAFVAMHGSWNRADRTGYKVVRLLFDKTGVPTGEYEDFVTGFVISDKQVWGRPVGVAVGKDGSLFVTDDGSGTIWRITYKGKR
jgi:glucose/arabinose dehydrogenase